MSFRLALRGALAALAVLALPCAAQVLECVRPAVFAPGALLRLTGRELGGVREVSFTALCGADALVLRRPVLRAEPGEVLVVAPAFGDHEPCTVGSPWGWVSVPGARPLPAFLLEGSAGRIAAAGAGSQLPEGGRLAIAFELAGGEPRPGNGSGTLELHGAPPGAMAFVAASLPVPPPWTRLRDATLVADLTPPCVLLGPFAVEADGIAHAPLPLPSIVGLRLAVQWLVGAGRPDDVLLSDALLIEL
jgi:hypothetical protein